MTIKRQRLSRLHRTRIYDAADGTCCICGLQIQGKRFVVEHVKPLWLGGADNDSNRRPAHERCAIDKTTSEAPVKAKTDRQRANYLGIRKATSRPLPGSRNSKFKKRMDGTVVLRDSR